jgi:hypothetical protein
VDGRVVEPVGAQRLDVCAADRRRRQRQLDGVVAEGAESRLEARRAVVVLGVAGKVV